MMKRISHSFKKQQHLASHPNSYSLALTASKGSTPLAEEIMTSVGVRKEMEEALRELVLEKAHSTVKLSFLFFGGRRGNFAKS